MVLWCTMQKRVVVPGEELAIAEEYSAGESTFEENERIYSAILGRVNYDVHKHEIGIVSDKNVKAFSVGCKVIGQVTAVRKNRALVKLLKASLGPERRVLTQFFATLFISNVADRFVKDLSEEFKIGDFIAAEVDSIKPYGVYLRTDKPSLGVIKAYCSKCRAPLYLTNNKLMCKHCGSVEKRKLSAEYILKV